MIALSERSNPQGMKRNGLNKEKKARASSEADSGAGVQEVSRAYKTLKDIAAVAGVSAMTVSNILRPKKREGRIAYSKQTAERVMQVAQEIGYLPNRAARAMRTRETGVIGFVSANFSDKTGNVENFGVHPFLVGLNHVLSSSGRHVALVELKELEVEQSHELPDALRESFFDALVVHYGVSEEALHLLEKHKVPLIYWDSASLNEVNCVYRNEVEVGRAVTQRLCDLGHKRIAFMTSRSSWEDINAGRSRHHSTKDRYEGYLLAMKVNRLKSEIVSGYQVEEMAEQIKQLGITGVVMQGGYVQLLRAAALLNRRIPDDLSVLTCDLETSIKDRGDVSGGACYNRYQAGRIVGEMLLKRLKTSGSDVRSVSLPVEVINGVTAAPPASENGNKV